MVSKPELIATEIGLPEGPVWCDDGTLVVTAVAEGALYRIWPGERRKARIADTRGGPNATALADDGGFVVTQNGGIDFAALPMPPELGAPSVPFPPPRFAEPGLQRVAPDGAVTQLLGGMQAPNDLAIGPDGTIFFTDPPALPVAPEARIGRVMARAPDGAVREIAGGFAYCNGIALAPDGALIVTEANGLMRVAPDGAKRWIVENLSDRPATDGIALDRDGRIYMAASMDHGIRVIEDGREVDFLALPVPGVSTNCCFGGADGRTLFLTDGWPGSVWMWTDMPTPGLPLHRWPAPR